MPSRRVLSFTRSALSAGTLLALCRGPGPAVAQVVIRPRPQPESAATSLPVVASRCVVQNLKRADDLIEQKKFADSLPYLQSLLDETGDSFLPGRRTAAMTSLKTAVEDRIARLPPEGARSYELQFGAVARELLNETSAAGDADGLCAVLARYRHTAAGREAAWQAWLRRLDEGRPR